MLGLCKSDGFLHEDPQKIRSMFSAHSQNNFFFFLYPLKDTVVASIKDFYGVLPNKVSVVEHDRLE